MAVSFTFWDDSGESKGKRVHLLRDPDGQPYLTQTEMKAVAGIVIGRHFPSKIDPVSLVCAIAELESDRLLLVTRSEGKSKQRRCGLMQLMPNDSEWLIRIVGIAYQLSLIVLRFQNLEFETPRSEYSEIHQLNQTVHSDKKKSAISMNNHVPSNTTTLKQHSIESELVDWTTLWKIQLKNENFKD
ncbi:hypothetical protein K1719_039400 [Acacia pycnantha]|nr:hypothetical protein K1719_039400 [Acacia pycnantha]